MYECTPFLGDVALGELARDKQIQFVFDGSVQIAGNYLEQIKKDAVFSHQKTLISERTVTESRCSGQTRNPVNKEKRTGQP